MDSIDFDIRIGARAGDAYPVSVTTGEGRVDGTLAPFDSQQILIYQQALQLAIRDSDPVRGSSRFVPTRNERPALDFGKLLFVTLFQGDIKERYEVERQLADKTDRRFRVRLTIDAPDLANLPWEFLYDPRESEFLCLMNGTAFVRYFDTKPVASLQIPGPLRVLGLAVSPTDERFAPLDVDAERTHVEASLAPLQKRGLVDLTWLEGQTVRDLLGAMRTGQWNVLHFIGHGDFDAPSDEGGILLADEQGGPQRLRASQLGRIVTRRPTLRLVILNACEGARGSSADIFSSTAATLVRRDVPAVLAMQYRIQDGSAIRFAQDFYQAVAEAMPLDAAVTEARIAISVSGASTIEWGAPVLYMQSREGVLFELPSSSAAVTAAREVKSAEPERPAGVSQEAPPPLALGEAPLTVSSELLPVASEEAMPESSSVSTGVGSVTTLEDPVPRQSSLRWALAALPYVAALICPILAAAAVVIAFALTLGGGLPLMALEIGTAIGAAAGLYVALAWSIGHSAPRDANAYAAREIKRRVRSLEDVVDDIAPFASVETPNVVASLRRIRRSLSNISDAMLGGGASWFTGAAYLDALELVHRAEEEYVNIAPVAELVASARNDADRMRPLDAPGAEVMRQETEQVARLSGEDKLSFAGVRQHVRTNRAAVNQAERDYWARQLRIRNRLLVLVALLGVATYLTAAGAVGNTAPVEVIVRGIFLYLVCGVVAVGALLVFAYGEPNHPNDFGVGWSGRVAMLLGSSLLGVLSAVGWANLVTTFGYYGQDVADASLRRFSDISTFVLGMVAALLITALVMWFTVLAHPRQRSTASLSE